MLTSVNLGGIAKSNPSTARSTSSSRSGYSGKSPTSSRIAESTYSQNIVDDTDDWLTKMIDDDCSSYRGRSQNKEDIYGMDRFRTSSSERSDRLKKESRGESFQEGRI